MKCNTIGKTMYALRENDRWLIFRTDTHWEMGPLTWTEGQWVWSPYDYSMTIVDLRELARFMARQTKKKRASFEERGESEQPG